MTLHRNVKSSEDHVEFGRRKRLDAGLVGRRRGGTLRGRVLLRPRGGKWARGAPFRMFDQKRNTWATILGKFRPERRSVIRRRALNTKQAPTLSNVPRGRHFDGAEPSWRHRYAHVMKKLFHKVHNRVLRMPRRADVSCDVKYVVIRKRNSRGSEGGSGPGRDHIRRVLRRHCPSRLTPHGMAPSSLSLFFNPPPPLTPHLKKVSLCNVRDVRDGLSSAYLYR